jgi:hypothetical protein
LNADQFARTNGRIVPMPPRKLVILFTSLIGDAIGLFAPVGVVK